MNPEHRSRAEALSPEERESLLHTVMAKQASLSLKVSVVFVAILVGLPLLNKFAPELANVSVGGFGTELAGARRPFLPDHLGALADLHRLQQQDRVGAGGGAWRDEMSLIPLFFVIAVTLATFFLGVFATKKASSASDFFVAGRSVSVGMNAAAISGEYLSAASFMGIAGLVMKNGYDALWYPVGYAAGYLFLLLFIAGPLRRFGAYTIPDFAEGRFDSPLFRKIAVTFVLFIGLFYTMPQMKGAGVTMNSIMGWPYWVGIVVVGTVISANVALGGMKGITFVQAFQYWAKLFAISVPVFVLMAVYGPYHTKLGGFSGAPKAAPTVDKDVTLKFVGKDKAPANGVSFSASKETVLEFTKEATQILKCHDCPQARTRRGQIQNRRRCPHGSTGTQGVASGQSIPSGATLTAFPIVVLKGARPIPDDFKPVMTAPKIEFATPTEAV